MLQRGMDSYLTMRAKHPTQKRHQKGRNIPHQKRHQKGHSSAARCTELMWGELFVGRNATGYVGAEGGEEGRRREEGCNELREGFPLRSHILRYSHDRFPPSKIDQLHVGLWKLQDPSANLPVSEEQRIYADLKHRVDALKREIIQVAHGGGGGSLGEVGGSTPVGMKNSGTNGASSGASSGNAAAEIMKSSLKSSKGVVVTGAGVSGRASGPEGGGGGRGTNTTASPTGDAFIALKDTLDTLTKTLDKHGQDSLLETKANEQDRPPVGSRVLHSLSSFVEQLQKRLSKKRSSDSFSHQTSTKATHKLLTSLSSQLHRLGTEINGGGAVADQDRHGGRGALVFSPDAVAKFRDALAGSCVEDGSLDEDHGEETSTSQRGDDEQRRRSSALVELKIRPCSESSEKEEDHDDHRQERSPAVDRLVALTQKLATIHVRSPKRSGSHHHHKNHLHKNQHGDEKSEKDALEEAPFPDAPENKPYEPLRPEGGGPEDEDDSSDDFPSNAGASDVQSSDDVGRLYDGAGVNSELAHRESEGEQSVQSRGTTEDESQAAALSDALETKDESRTSADFEKRPTFGQRRRAATKPRPVSKSEAECPQVHRFGEQGTRTRPLFHKAVDLQATRGHTSYGGILALLAMGQYICQSCPSS